MKDVKKFMIKIIIPNINYYLSIMLNWICLSCAIGFLTVADHLLRIDRTLILNNFYRDMKTKVGFLKESNKTVFVDKGI